MRQLIRGKIYDTDNADWVATKPISPGEEHSPWKDEDLFRTPKGRFFLLGRRWATNHTGQLGIKPLTPDEALEWCETNGISELTIASYFDIEEA